MEVPKRCYVMNIEVDGDTLKDVCASLNNIVHELMEMDYKGHQNPHKSMSGSPSAGYCFELVKTDTKDHADYIEKLDNYLDEVRKNKGGNDE